MALTINKVILVGNVGGEVKVKNLPGKEGQEKLAMFSLATSSGYGDNATTEWHNIVAFRKLAEIAEKYVVKGLRVGVEGSLRTRKWEGTDGRTHSVTEIVADALRLDSAKARAAEPAQDRTPAGNIYAGAPQGADNDFPF